MDYQVENTRYCLRKGHEENRASYIFIYQGGQQTQQWLCVDCILQYFDNDGKPSTNHNMRKNLFLDFIKQQSQPIHYQNKESKKQIQICIKRLQQFIQSTYFLIQQLQEEMKTILEIEEIIKLTQKDHNLLINEQIDKIINLNNCNKKFDYSLSSDLLKQVIQDFIDLQNQLYNKNKNNNKEQKKILITQELDLLKKSVDDGYQIEGVSKKTINQKNDTDDFINECEKNIMNSSKTIPKIKNRKYIVQEIIQQNNYYHGSSISNNENYLAYGGCEKLLKIYDIKKRYIIKEINLDYDLNVCQFTQDSSQLYIGLNKGYVCGYDVQDDFQEIYNQKIHQNKINSLITIQNEFLITCSDDENIIKTHIKSKQQIFKLTGNTSTIDYNDKDDIIVSGSDDYSIKLWDCRNQSIIIDKERSHNHCIRQIQLINNNLYILSLDQDGNLYKWKICLNYKDLIKIQQFSDQNQIFNFYQVNQDQNLLLICNNYAKILNLQGEAINTIEHRGKNSFQFGFRQLDNMDQIQIRTNQQIILAIAQD